MERGRLTALARSARLGKVVLVVLEVARLEGHERHERGLLAHGRDAVLLERGGDVRCGLVGGAALILVRGVGARGRLGRYVEDLLGCDA